MMVTGNSSSSLRSLQAGSKEASILLELLQGSSGQAFASKNQGWDQATAVCEWSGISCGSSGEIETINISESGLEGTIPQALDQLSTVVDILMASNNLQGSIPSTVLGLPKLKNIDLSFNSLEGWIPFPMSSSLEMVRLGHNKLTGGVPRSFANGLDKLKIFDVKYNMLTGLLPDLTATLPSIQSLDLSNNRFQGAYYLGSVITSLLLLFGKLNSNLTQA
jgi:Leucine-rich repeat (LRR) protein